MLDYLVSQFRLLLSEPEHTSGVCPVGFSGKPEQKRRDAGHCSVQAGCSLAAVPCWLANAGCVCPRRLLRRK